MQSAQPISTPAAELLERWLAARLCLPSGAGAQVEGPRLPPTPRTELLDSVRALLDRRPALAQAARRLSTYDQFRLTLDLVRAAAPIAPPSQRVDLVARPLRDGPPVARDVAGGGAPPASRQPGVCFSAPPGRRRAPHGHPRR